MDDEIHLNTSSSDDVIDQVARANYVKAEDNILPEIQATRCLIHGRNYKRNDLLYTSNHHGGKVVVLPPPPHRARRCVDTNSDFKVPDIVSTLTSRVPDGRAACYRRPCLPEELPSQVFVASWLMHGSQPASENHFPDIVVSGNRKSKTSKPFVRDLSIRLSKQFI